MKQIKTAGRRNEAVPAKEKVDWGTHRLKSAQNKCDPMTLSSHVRKHRQMEKQCRNIHIPLSRAPLLFHQFITT